jgi:predicted ATPase/DNA-binding SARP family transcriptional activator
VELRVLGPVELVGADGPVSLGGGKQRRLLAVLAIRAGEALPADVLIDAVWGPTPPRSAAKLLQVYVSQLRKLLEPPIAIRTRPGGYVLECAGGGFDRACFERLVEDGRTAAAEGNPGLASSLIGRAVGLWRGPAFGELAYEEFALGEAERLEELRLLAGEVQSEAELALGRHVELLPELQKRAHVHPLRERTQAHAMLALYRCGRQAEALEVYNTTYTQLRDQLGLDPSMELRELQRRILQQDAELATVPPTPRPPASLPAAPNRLVGRGQELEELQVLLTREGVRLLVLTGAGGSGKTRLALETARRASARFANGALFIELASVRDPQLVLEAVARVCGVQEAPGGDPLQSLFAALRSRELLLVLDNFEHLRAAGPDIVRLLAGSPHLTVLVTSRVVLHVSGEYVYPVQPLRPADAVALFCARARQIDHGFSPDSATHEVIAQVCSRLDGLPLAIELAAARTHLLTPSQLRQRLHARLPLLTAGPHDLPARQRTLRATLEWSYDLLSAGEQRLFHHLAVFAGGFDLRGAEAVCDAQLDTLGSLVDHSLVQRVPGGRLVMLETLREFALERLTASGEAPEIRRRHALHFRDVALSANLREDAEGNQRPDLVVEDQDNIRAALGWAFGSDQITIGLEVAVALEWFWWTSAAPEGTRWFEMLLSHPCAGQTPPAMHARALRAYGTTIVFAGDLDGAQTPYRQSLDTFRRLGDEPGAAGALLCLAANAADRGDIATARDLIEQSLEILRRVGNKTEETAALHILGKVECDEGNYYTGIQSLQRAVTLFGAAGHRYDQAFCLGELCQRAFESGRTSQTEAWGRQTLALCQTVGDRQTQLFVLTLLARTALQQARTREAGVLWGAVEAGQNQAPVGWWTLTPDQNHFSPARYIAPLLAEHDPEFEDGRVEGLRLSLNDTVSRIVGSRAEDAVLARQAAWMATRLE